MATLPQTVRRDNCELTKSLIDTCLRKILIDRDTRAAEECVDGRVGHAVRRGSNADAAWVQLLRADAPTSTAT